jgi:Coenzyme PQQ synthesis protein D (PqqD)
LRFQVSDSVAAREIEGELVLLDLEGGRFFVSRGTGPRVWEMLSSGKTIDEVVQEIAGRYGIDRDRVRADVEEFVRQLREKGMLVEDRSA